MAGAAVFGIAGAGAAWSRPASTAYDAVPSLVGAGIAGGVLILLLHRAYRQAAVPSEVEVPVPVGVGGRSDTGPTAAPTGGPPTLIHFDRRAFLRAAALVAGGAVLAGGGAAVQRARGGAMAASREAINCRPPPTRPSRCPPASHPASSRRTPASTASTPR